MSDPQDVAEAVDSDKLDDVDDYGEEDIGDYPPDQPSGVGPMAMTPAEEAFPEPMGLRAWREEPDPLADELDQRADELDEEAGGSAARDPELGGLDLGPELGDDVDRLVATTPLVGDDEASLVAGEVAGPGEESAEEAAMHGAPEPPLRAGDSYLDDEP